MTKEQFINNWWPACTTTFVDELDALIAYEIEKAKEQPQPKSIDEKFTEVHHKIVDGLGTILSNLGANSGIMSILMSWGDTQDSVSTLEMLNDYIEKYIIKQPQPELNEIERAYEEGKKIKKKYWSKEDWIKKHSNTLAIDDNGTLWVLNNDYPSMKNNPEKWEIYEHELDHTKPISQVKLDNSFDKDRFERVFCAVVASGRTERWEQDFKSTEEALKQLDAYYAEKEKGGNNG